MPRPPTVPPPAVVGLPVEQVLYRGDGLTVTTAIVIVGDATFPSASVASVTLKEHPWRGIRAPVHIVAGVVLVCVGGAMHSGSDAPGFLGTLFVFAGVVMAARACANAGADRRSYRVVLRTTNGKSYDVHGNDRADLERATDAVARAMGKR